ncbi:A-kinase anchor protein 5 [Struthio camelus]|uniref:A-kinase anchor protein 5 n=1 Tax=Struthio camelus TaxID=8801 RepID=UPI003603DB5D
MAKAAREIQTESAGEPGTPGAAAARSPAEERAEKPSVFCFKKRKASCKGAKDEGDPAACPETGHRLGADPGEATVPSRSQSPRGAWAALKSLARPRRRLSSSSRKKAPADAQVRLETSVEEAGARGGPRPRGSSGWAMPCLRLSRGRKRPSPSEAAEDSEGSVKASEAAGVVSKASEEPADSAPADKADVAESSGQVSGEEKEREVAAESADAAGKREPLAEPSPGEDEAPERAVQPEKTRSETANEPVQDKLPEGSPHPAVVDAEAEEAASEAPVSEEPPGSAPEVAAGREMAASRQEPPDGDGGDRSANRREEQRGADGAATRAGRPAASAEAARAPSRPVEPPGWDAAWEAGGGVGIVITVTAAADSDDADSDQTCQPSPVLRPNKQKGPKKGGGSEAGHEEGSAAGGGRQLEDKGLGEPGHRTAEQREVLLVETASSLVKAAIQASIEQLLNEMALEQNKENSFL